MSLYKYNLTELNCPFFKIMFLDVYGAKYAAEPLCGSAFTVGFQTHDEQAVLHMNNVVFSLSANTSFTEQCGNLQFSKNPTNISFCSGAREPFL